MLLARPPLDGLSDFFKILARRIVFVQWDQG
jgi:hypothetical protein